MPRGLFASRRGAVRCLALGSDHQHRGERAEAAADKPSATSKSARIRKAPAVAAFGAQGELALKLRALGDELDDVVAGLRNRDALALGAARKLVASWQAIGEPLLWYPTELRCAGKLVIAAELERACYVLPAYQAGLRALEPSGRMTADDVLALGEQLLSLERAELSHEAFFMWLWSGNPSGIGALLGHPLAAMPDTVLEQPIAPDEIWQSHTSAAMEEWNTLAWSAAQLAPAAELEQRYRAPVAGLMQRIAAGPVGLSPGESDALRAGCDDEQETSRAQLALVVQRPELAALLRPSDAGAWVHAALAARVKLPTLLSCIGAMSAPAAAAAIAAEPRLMQHAPRLCHELLAGKHARSSLLMRALLARGGAGLRALCRALGQVTGHAPGPAHGFDDELLGAVLGACVELGHGPELLAPLWAKRDAATAVRALALHALRRNEAAFQHALALAPLTAGDPPELHALAAALRGSEP